MVADHGLCDPGLRKKMEISVTLLNSDWMQASHEQVKIAYSLIIPTTQCKITRILGLLVVRFRFFKNSDMISIRNSTTRKYTNI